MKWRAISRRLQEWNDWGRMKTKMTLNGSSQRNSLKTSTWVDQTKRTQRLNKTLCSKSRRRARYTTQRRFQMHSSSTRHTKAWWRWKTINEPTSVKIALKKWTRAVWSNSRRMTRCLSTSTWEVRLWLLTSPKAVTRVFAIAVLLDLGMRQSTLTNRKTSV